MLGWVFEKSAVGNWICFPSVKCSGQGSDFYLVLVRGPFASDGEQPGNALSKIPEEISDNAQLML
jgi:hypothetical protein